MLLPTPHLQPPLFAVPISNLPQSLRLLPLCELSDISVETPCAFHALNGSIQALMKTETLSYPMSKILYSSNNLIELSQGQQQLHLHRLQLFRLNLFLLIYLRSAFLQLQSPYQCACLVFAPVYLSALNHRRSHQQLLLQLR